MKLEFPIRSLTTAWFRVYHFGDIGPDKRGNRTCKVLLHLSGNACQLNRSTQHFLEVYSQESEILKSFLSVDLGAAPLCPDPLAYSQTGRFS
jgi:hypothetical protein